MDWLLLREIGYGVGKKIMSLFQRNYDTDRLVRNEVVPGAESRPSVNYASIPPLWDWVFKTSDSR